VLEAGGPQTQVTVLDINGDMLGVGRERAAKRFPGDDRIAFVEANAEALPLEGGQFDAYTIAFGIRNVPRIDKALSEAYAILISPDKRDRYDRTGKADGADAAGARWARGRGIPVHDEPITAEDMKLGKYLGPRQRNRRILAQYRPPQAGGVWSSRTGGTSARPACRPSSSTRERAKSGRRDNRPRRPTE
jgi:SAM-dependent methyltransferase